ncbi:MAG TPA: nicotinamide-nucleotide amidohydrolase family protein [Burkholderiaceae bacterium]|nr:nicotinamide-nucleotide amidohydrolase family protein [Burkholderiaceae bacterium]
MNEPTHGVSDADLVAAAAALGAELKALGLSACTAESCTGGLVAWALTETAGSSDWFDRGHVTYSNAAKREVLGVAAATLDAHGAVSEPVAREMAIGALARSEAALAIAITGIAGPGGGSPGKPVGTVCFGWAFAAPGLPAGAPRVEVRTMRLDGDRAAVRRASARVALERALALVRAELADRPPAA